MRGFAEQLADDQIALILHHRGARIAKGLTFKARHVTNLRRCHKIPGHTSARLATEHVYSARQAAKLFAVSQPTPAQSHQPLFASPSERHRLRKLVTLFLRDKAIDRCQWSDH